MRQRLFVAALVADEKRNATAAAIKAGYSSKPGSANRQAFLLMQNKEIQDEIERRLKPILDEYQVTADSVIKGICDSIEAAKQAGIGAWQTSAIQRGYEMLGRSLGLFKDKIDVNAEDNQIIAMLHKGRQRAAGLAEEDSAEEELLDQLVAEEEAKKPN
jgi:hypothetical protein